MGQTRSILVPAARLPRWLENFEKRHGLTLVTGAPLTATAQDGSTATVHGPFGLVVGHVPFPLPEVRWGVLLVRKGGFAIAAGTTMAPALRKVGRRHVQGRSKAGGWSQQRFARRRDNQAREAFEAAAHHAHRILVTEFGGIDSLVCGGDRRAVEGVLDDPRLAGLRALVVPPWLPTPDPTGAVLDKAIVDAWSCRLEITDQGE